MSVCGDSLSRLFPATASRLLIFAPIADHFGKFIEDSRVLDRCRHLERFPFGNQPHGATEDLSYTRLRQSVCQKDVIEGSDRPYLLADPLDTICLELAGVDCRTGLSYD